MLQLAVAGINPEINPVSTCKGSSKW